ncbi:MAG: putative permease, partial [Enterobacterales bacterium]
MTGIFSRWFQRNFSNPQAVVLVVFLVVGFAFILTLGDILNPLFIAIVLAYLLEWVVATIHNKGCPRGIAVFSVYTGFIA